jgi:hypothetical protein
LNPQTDSTGTAQLVAGNIRLPVQLFDEESGSTLSGFSLGLVVDPHRQGQAILAAIDTLGRYPTHFFLLRGSSGPSTGSEQGGIIATALAALAKNGSQAGQNIPPVKLVIDRPCSSDGSFTHIVTPIETPHLPALKAAAPPPAPGKQGQDLSDPGFDILLKAKQLAAELTDPIRIKNETISCDEVIPKLLSEVSAVAAARKLEETIMEMPAVLPAKEMFPQFGNFLEYHTAAEIVGSAISGFTALNACGSYWWGGDSQSTKLVWKYSVLNNEFLSFYAPAVPVGAVPWDPSQFTYALVSPVDEGGNPISGGSVEMFSKNHLGLGFRAVIDDNGLAALPVLLNDSGEACVRSPGVITQAVFDPCGRKG